MTKRIFTAILAIVMICSFSTFGANAFAAAPEMSASEQFLNEFLSDLMNGNVKDAFETIEDERIELNPDISLNSISEEEAEYIRYVESIEHFEEEYEKEKISSFSGIKEIGNNIIIADIVFADGSEATVPFHIIPKGKSFIVKFTTDDISETGYVKIKEGLPLAPSLENNAARAASTLKDSYDFSYLYGTIYGIDSFSVSRNAIKIVGYQANDALETGWQSPAEVIYATVVKHWYGDNVWASTVNSIKKNGSFNVTLVGKNSSQSDLRIRISNQTGAYPRSKGNGKIYSVSV